MTCSKTSRSKVPAIETRIDPRQPRLLEKKTNTRPHGSRGARQSLRALVRSAGPRQDADTAHAVFSRRRAWPVNAASVASQAQTIASATSQP
jgi:hypothetical protein